MHGENLLIDDGRNGQAVEAVGKGLPQLDVISPFALIVETVDSVNGGTLVVATEDEEVLGVFDLVGEEKADGFQGLLATVDVVSEEKVVGLWREATVFEQTQKIVVLTVNITANLKTMLLVPCSTTVKFFFFQGMRGRQAAAAEEEYIP